MGILQATILGIVQGFTEFLPISSSAHLLFIPKIFGWNDIPDSFEVALHFGTLLAILLVFYKDWIEMIKSVYLNFKYKYIKSGKLNNEERNNIKRKNKLFWYLVLSTIIVAGISFLVDDSREVLKKSSGIVYVMAFSLIFMGIILYFVDKNRPNKIKMDNMNFKTALTIGVSQIIALIPGMSRSGTTITTARIMGVNKKDAARYSFLLATPIIFAATILKMKEFTFTLPFICGVISSFLVGFLVLKFFMKYLETKDYKVFAIYRVIIGIILILMGIFKFI